MQQRRRAQIHRERRQGLKAFGWEDSYLLGYAPMDDTHREFVEVVDALLTCADADMAARFEDFIRHAEEHFGEEDEWMRKTDFPPKDCHIDEHAAVMTSVRTVFEQVKAGDYAEGRRLAKALADWFPGHAFHLDSALSHWMCKRAFGGKPVVVRRNILNKDA